MPWPALCYCMFCTMERSDGASTASYCIYRAIAWHALCYCKDCADADGGGEAQRRRGASLLKPKISLPTPCTALDYWHNLTHDNFSVLTEIIIKNTVLHTYM